MISTKKTWTIIAGIWAITQRYKALLNLLTDRLAFSDFTHWQSMAIKNNTQLLSAQAVVIMTWRKVTTKGPRD